MGEQGTYPFGESWYNNSTTSNWVYTTYERDTESGDDYALARSYANTNGRFLSPDPLEGIVGDPQSWNRYAYVENDPINLSDPSGQGFWEDLGFAIADIFLTIIPGAQAALPVVLGAEAGAEASNIDVTLDDGTQVVGPWGGSGPSHAGERVWALSRSGPWYPDDEASIPTCGNCDGGPGAGTTDPGSTGAGSQGPGSGSGGGDTVGNDIWREGPNCQGCGVIWSNANSSVYQFMRYQLYDAAGGLAVAGIARVAGAVRALPRVQLAVGPGQPFHVAVQVGNTWIRAYGTPFSRMVMTSYRAAELAETAWFKIPIPVRSEAAVLASKTCSAASCATGAISAVIRGWFP